MIRMVGGAGAGVVGTGEVMVGLIVVVCFGVVGLVVDGARIKQKTFDSMILCGRYLNLLKVYLND